jgi:hypothetical protein
VRSLAVPGGMSPIDPSKLPVDPFNPTGGVYSHDTKLRRVWSFGPDRTNDRGLLEYDPTNGMESRGDIVCVLAAGEGFVGVD